MTTILITGANRGIGLGIARHAVARNHTVIAGVRNPDDAHDIKGIATSVHRLDTTDQASITKLAGDLAQTPIDILVNNAGVFPHECDDINDFDVEAYERVMRINTLGPILMSRAMIPHVERSQRKLIVQITSNLGSITDASKGHAGFLGYRTSKAALNMASATMAHQLKDKGITCVALHPGWVKTDMGGPMGDLTPEDATASIMSTIESLTHDDNGAYMDYAGKTLTW